MHPLELVKEYMSVKIQIKEIKLQKLKEELIMKA
jgi:hypothetical protein